MWTSTAPTAKSKKGPVFRLLDLPTEVLQYYLDTTHEKGEPARLHRLSKGNLSSTNPMSQLKKHDRSEYLASLLRTLRSGTMVEAHVLDFDFRHVVTFYNSLDESQLHGFPAKEAALPKETAASRLLRERSTVGGEGKMKIVLDFSRGCAWTFDAVEAWMRRINHPTKKGSKVKVEYEVRSRRVLGQWIGRSNWLSLAKGIVDSPELDGQGDDGLVELRKIVEAVDVI